MIFLLRLILNYMLCSYIYIVYLYIYILYVHYIYIVQVNVYGFGYRYVFEKVYMFTRDIWLFCVVVICNFVCMWAFEGMDIHDERFLLGDIVSFDKPYI